MQVFVSYLFFFLAIFVTGLMVVATYFNYESGRYGWAIFDALLVLLNIYSTVVGFKNIKGSYELRDMQRKIEAQREEWEKNNLI